MQPGHSPYFVIPDSIDIKASSISLKLQNSINSVPLSLDLYTHTDNTVRLKLNEASPLKPRYEIPLGDVLVEEPTREKWAYLQHSCRCYTIHCLYYLVWFSCDKDQYESIEIIQEHASWRDLDLIWKNHCSVYILGIFCGF